MEKNPWRPILSGVPFFFWGLSEFANKATLIRHNNSKEIVFLTISGRWATTCMLP